MRFFGKNTKKGQMLVLAAISLSALIGLAGFGVDVANLIVKEYQLQKALDAAVLNSIVYTESNINRGMTLNALKDNATVFVKQATIANLKMMGFTNISDANLIMNGSDGTGIKIFISGQEVTGGSSGSSGCGENEDFTGGSSEHITSIKICVIAKLEAKTLLMKFFGLDHTFLKVTSCSRRIAAAIAMVLDTSGSMGASFPLLQEGAKSFIDQFQESIDMISIITFNTHVKIWMPLTRIKDAQYQGYTGKAALKRIIDGLTASGDTNLPAALIAARKELEKTPQPAGHEPGAFKTFVIFSDGAPTAMTVDFTDAYTSIPWQLSNPVKGPSGTLDDKRWDPSEWGGPLPVNNQTGEMYSFDNPDPNKHIYTYRAGLYEQGSLLLNPTAPSIPVPCSSGNKVHLLWEYAFIYNDPSDCLKSVSFKDSKGNQQNVDIRLWLPYPYKFATHINNHGLDYMGRYDMQDMGGGYWTYIDGGYYGWEGQPAYWGNNYASGGPSSGNTVLAMRLPYIEAIIEGDYALANGVTIFAVGLSKTKVLCGPESDPYMPCCGPGSQDVNHNEIPCTPPGQPCVANDPRPICQPQPPCDPSTDIYHCQPINAGPGGGS